MTKGKMISPYAFPGIKHHLLPKKFYVKKPVLSPEKLMELIANQTFTTISDIISVTRKSEVVVARHIFCGIMRKDYDYSLKFIGDMIKRDHTTIMNAVMQFDNRSSNEEFFGDLVNQIRKTITNY